MAPVQSESAAAPPTRALSVIVPVCNAAATLETLVARLDAVLSPLLPYEIVLVDDGSRDESWAVVCQLGSRSPLVRGIQLMRNFGQHNALLAGIRAARHDVIVTLDDDLQNPPEEIPSLLAKLDEGYDVVYGTPVGDKHGLWRRLAARVTKVALQNAMGSETARNVSAYRVFRTALRDPFAEYHAPFVSIDVLLAWATTSFAAVPVRHDPRQFGRSNYTFARLFTHAMNMMTGFSTRPLQLASFVGFAFALFGVGVFAYVLAVVALYGHPVPGFAFIASIIAIFSGAQLFAIGIIGEYLARIHFRTMQRPVYAVRQHTGAGSVAFDEGKSRVSEQRPRAGDLRSARPGRSTGRRAGSS